MASKPDGCRGCPLYSKSSQFVPDKQTGAEVVLFLDKPSRDDLRTGKTLTGDAGWVYKNTLLTEVGGEVDVAFVRRCGATADARTIAVANAHCRTHDAIGDAVRLIVACGEDAWAMVGRTGDPQPEWRGHGVRMGEKSTKAGTFDLKIGR